MRLLGLSARYLVQSCHSGPALGHATWGPKFRPGITSGSQLLPPPWGILPVRPPSLCLLSTPFLPAFLCPEKPLHCLNSASARTANYPLFSTRLGWWCCLPRSSTTCPGASMTGSTVGDLPRVSYLFSGWLQNQLSGHCCLAYLELFSLSHGDDMNLPSLCEGHWSNLLLQHFLFRVLSDFNHSQHFDQGDDSKAPVLNYYLGLVLPPTMISLRPREQHVCHPRRCSNQPGSYNPSPLSLEATDVADVGFLLEGRPEPFLFQEKTQENPNRLLLSTINCLVSVRNAELPTARSHFMELEMMSLRPQIPTNKKITERKLKTVL